MGCTDAEMFKMFRNIINSYSIVCKDGQEVENKIRVIDEFQRLDFIEELYNIERKNEELWANREEASADHIKRLNEFPDSPEMLEIYSENLSDLLDALRDLNASSDKIKDILHKFEAHKRDNRYGVI